MGCLGTTPGRLHRGLNCAPLQAGPERPAAGCENQGPHQPRRNQHCPSWVQLFSPAGRKELAQLRQRWMHRPLSPTRVGGPLKEPSQDLGCAAKSKLCAPAIVKEQPRSWEYPHRSPTRQLSWQQRIMPGQHEALPCTPPNCKPFAKAEHNKSTT